jgi:hypothetical protein
MSKEPAAFSYQAEKLIAALRRVPDDTPARMKKRPTKELSGLVEELMLKFQIGRDSPEDKIRANWSELVGPANAHYSHASQIDQRGKLIILAGHAVVRNELFIHRKTIVERIQKLPGCAHVRELHIRAG